MDELTPFQILDLQQRMGEVLGYTVREVTAASLGYRVNSGMRYALYGPDGKMVNQVGYFVPELAYQSAPEWHNLDGLAEILAGQEVLLNLAKPMKATIVVKSPGKKNETYTGEGITIGQAICEAIIAWKRGAV